MRDTKWDELDRPLTEDEKAWLLTREMDDVVEANAEKFDVMADGEDGDQTPEVVDPGYEKWTAEDLKAEAGRRELDIAGMKKKSEVAAALRADDAANDAGE